MMPAEETCCVRCR